MMMHHTRQWVMILLWQVIFQGQNVLDVCICGKQSVCGSSAWKKLIPLDLAHTNSK